MNDPRVDRSDLIEVLERSVFRPVLSTAPEDFAEEDRLVYRHVRTWTEEARRRYREQYRSAREVWEQFRNDLSSDPGLEAVRGARSLGLPSFEDARGELERAAHRAGVF